MFPDLVRDLRGSHKYGHVLVAVTVPVLFAMSFPEEEWSRVVAVILTSGSRSRSSR